MIIVCPRRCRRRLSRASAVSSSGNLTLLLQAAPPRTTARRKRCRVRKIALRGAIARQIARAILRTLYGVGLSVMRHGACREASVQRQAATGLNVIRPTLPVFFL